jgi:hypothetical protein
MMSKMMFALVGAAVAQQTCEDLRDSFQDNECCAANLKQELATPLTTPTADSIAAKPAAFTQMLHQSYDFRKFTHATLGVEKGGVTSYTPSLMSTFKPIGSITEHICEATDAAWSATAVVADGHSGDREYPHGDIKVLATMGEYLPSTGYMLVGVPDGMGAYLTDASTVRIVFQSESYGPLNWWCTSLGCGDSYPFIVNSNGASFTGSHVMYVDYDRAKLAEFMDGTYSSAESMIKDAGNAIHQAYNLAGNLIEPRVKTGTGCTTNPHYSNTDPNGCNANWNQIMLGAAPERADWVMQSLCSAHLEERHQWGGALGVEDTLFITNEEWTSFTTGSDYTGIPAHVIDMATMTAYAAGVFTLGGFEKIVEFNCGHPDYVCFAPSGYNGNFDVDKTAEAARKNALGVRPDGTSYVFPKYIVPARVYVGVKGKDAAGATSTGFLARNGLAYGKVYGFATDVAQTTGGRFQEDWHKNVALPGDTVVGAFYPIDWQWDGTVRTFMYDGSWDFQHKTSDNLYFWNQGGSSTGSTFDTYGSCKTEHNSPDPYGGPRVMQTSTCGYFGIYDLSGVTALLTAAKAAGTWFPTKIPSTYTNLQGERDITSQIVLGGKGVSANGNDQKYFVDSQTAYDAGPGGGKNTFEDIDGFEWIAAAGTTDGYVIIQEDGGNWFGERTFISKVRTDGVPMTYYFIAMSGGRKNTRMLADVGVPAHTNDGVWASSAHEFSGVIDLSGMLAKDANGNFIAVAGVGATKRAQEKLIPINNKTIAFGLQAHQLSAGIIRAMSGDRGGQLYAYQPSIPAVDA